MEIRQLITIEAILIVQPSTIYYGANTCWWTHDSSHLSVTASPPAQSVPSGRSLIEKGLGRRVNPGSIPTDPRGGVLFETDDIEGFFASAKANVSFYGKHGLRAFIAAHHLNSFLNHYDQRPYCSPNWAEYNDAIDRYDEHQNKRGK